MYTVLMVCTGNICRSPIAAGLLDHYLPEDLKSRVAVSSAGTYALHGNQADIHAMYAMDQIGINISSHRARQITKEMARSTDLILTMEVQHAKLIKGMLGWRQKKPRLISEFGPPSKFQNIADPYGGPVSQFEQCIKTLKPCIDGLIPWLRTNV